MPAEQQPDSTQPLEHGSKLWVCLQKLWVGVQKLWAGIKKLPANTKEWLFCVPLVRPAREGVVQPWTITHGFFVQMGGFVRCENGEPIKPLSFSEIKEYIQAKTIEAPRITEAEIMDRSRGDIISKTLVVLQTTWFVAQCVARWATGIPVTQLEIATLAFAALNGLTYTLWWHKPQNIGVPVYLEINLAPLTHSLADEPTLAGSNNLEPELGNDPAQIDTEMENRQPT